MSAGLYETPHSGFRGGLRRPENRDGGGPRIRIVLTPEFF